MPQVKPSENKSWREIYQCFAGMRGWDNIVVPAVIAVDVDLYFRPDLLSNSVLKRVVPEQIVSDDARVSGGQAAPECSLDVEILKPLP